jgi:hypothetical protein
MKRLAIAFFISSILHVFVVFITFHIRSAKKTETNVTLLSPYPEWILLDDHPSNIEKSSSGGPGEARPGFASAPPGASRGSSEGTAAQGGGEGGPAGIPVPKPMVPLRSPFAVRGTNVKAGTDSLVRSRVSDWFAEQDFSGVKAFHDAVDDRIQRRAGGSDVFSPWKNRTAESHKEEKNEVQFDFLPDETHVQAMSTLYKRGKATQKDLYLDLDPSIPMTAALFDKQLEFLVEKGFVTRKKISPENLFGIATPFGVIPIEMSRKNKLNPVYEYKSQVDREKLLAFLQSNEFLLHERLKKAAPKDTAMVQKLIRRCEKGMGILAR